MNFINGLKRVKNAAALELASWIEKTYATNPNLSDQLINIVETNESTVNKTKAIEQLKNTTEQAESGKNKSYFTNISTLAKATAAFLITAHGHNPHKIKSKTFIFLNNYTKALEFSGAFVIYRSNHSFHTPFYSVKPLWYTHK